MFYLIPAIILGLIIVGSIVAAFATRNTGAFVVTGLSTVALLLFTLFCSITTVDARAVGIQTAFGRYQGTLDPGLQLVAPWSSVEEFTTRLQSADLNDLDESKNNSVYVAFSAPKNVGPDGQPLPDEKAVAGGGNGNINAIVRWQISPDNDGNGAKALWEKYKEFDRVNTDLVLSTSQDIIADVANDFPAGEAAVNQNGIGAEVQKRLATALKPYGIIVDSVSIKRVQLDDATRGSLQRIVDNINKTQAALEEEKRAAIDNRIAKTRAETGAISEKANERYCLDVVNAWDVAKNGPLPATFNCGLGGQPPVLVGAGK